MNVIPSFLAFVANEFNGILKNAFKDNFNFFRETSSLGFCKSR